MLVVFCSWSERWLFGSFQFVTILLCPYELCTSPLYTVLQQKGKKYTCIYRKALCLDESEEKALSCAQ